MYTALDIFCHFLPPMYYSAIMAATNKNSHMFVRAQSMPAMTDFDARIAVMQQFEGYAQIPCLVSPAIEFFVGPDKSPEIAKIGNDELAELSARRPDMFPSFIASLPMNNIEASLMEMKRCINDLHAAGIQIFTNVNGRPIDTEEYLPIFECANALDIPIWLHPVRGVSTPEYAMEKNSQYELWWTIGWPYETTVAMCRLVFSGIFEKYPDIKIITHHVGGMIPMLEGRLENGLKLYGTRTAPELKEELTATPLTEPPITAMKRFYTDTASFGSRAAIECGLNFFDSDKILFATDMPFDPECGPGYIRSTLKAIDELKVSQGQKENIRVNNARRAIKI